MHVLIIAIGSYGDVHPFLGIARALRAREHHVTFLASSIYTDLVRRLGFEFIPLGTDEDMLSVMRDPDIWHRTRGLMRIARIVNEETPRLYQTIVDHLKPNDTVLVYSTLAIGARLVQEKQNVPGVSVHLSPSIFQSVHETPKYPGVFMPNWLPKSLKRLMFSYGDRHIIDKAFGPALNAFRAQLGLQPVHGILSDWIHSPDRVIGLFPAWFAAPQPDWPAQTVLTGFPLYDENDVTPLPNDARQFLENGPPPIVFTPGSAMWHGEAFFEAAVDACNRLDRRGLLLSRHAHHIPHDLPVNVKHVLFAPFSQILTHAAALVHHGGIGTTAQAMRAGVPQVIMPMSHDQPDNAARVARLGVGTSLSPEKFTGPRLAKTLATLLESPRVAAACQSLAENFGTEANSLVRTAEAIERLAPACTIASAPQSRVP